MPLAFEKYEKSIHLNDPHTPTKTGLTGNDREEVVAALLSELGIRDVKLSYGENRQYLEKTLVELPPEFELTNEFYDLSDVLLTAELAEKSLTDAASLPRIASRNYTNLSRVSLWKGDIATLKIDAIVNAANNQMLGCFIPFHRCIDNVIHCAAGPRLRQDCHTIMTGQGTLEATGQAKVTRAYNLPSSYVIHTVGPIVQGPLQDQHKTDLRKVYFNCLELTRKIAAIRSIAFCSVSTGLFGFPFEEAAKIALHTINDWLCRNPDGLDHVVINVFKDDEKSIYQELAGCQNEY